jgi:hypothetical protein
MMPEDLAEKLRRKRRERTYQINAFIQLSFNHELPSNNETSSPDRSMYDAAVFTVLSFSFKHDIEERRWEAPFPLVVVVVVVVVVDGGGGGLVFCCWHRGLGFMN